MRLQKKLLMDFLKANSNDNFIEHHGWYYNDTISEIELPGDHNPILFLQRERAVCFKIDKINRSVETNYYVGVDWIIQKEKAVYVEPKLNKDSAEQTDYLKMMFSALKHKDIAEHTKDLFEIKWDSPQIEIEQQKDLLTPLLVVQFLNVVKAIVRKGLKKSYYRIEENFYGRVKGKVLVGQTIKQNLLKNKSLNTYCSYNEFGCNGLENRLIKKALVFVQRYLPTLKNIDSKAYLTNAFNYVNPPFEKVSEEVNLFDIKHTKTNPFYKEYKEAIKLAKLILKRFSYNITNANNQSKVQTPPFWIDMSKLFELYVLALLKDKFKGQGSVAYHFGNRSNELDYLLNAEGYKMVIDAKYKPRYKSGLDQELHQDIRQVSGYARLEIVYDHLKMDRTKLIDCLIIYPDQSLNRLDLNDWDHRKEEINGYVGIYKMGVSLPTQNNLIKPGQNNSITDESCLK